MDETPPGNSLETMLAESQRLRKAAEETLRCYVAIQKRIHEIEAKFEARPDGTVRLKKTDKVGSP